MLGSNDNPESNTTYHWLIYSLDATRKEVIKECTEQKRLPKSYIICSIPKIIFYFIVIKTGH